MNEPENTEALIHFVEKNHNVEAIDVSRGNEENVTLLAVPKGKEIVDTKEIFDRYRQAPERRSGTACVGTLASFVDHVKRFADEDSALFACRSQQAASLLAVLDYHRKGSKGAPRFGAHRTFYNFPISTEWQLWNDASGTTLEQQDFAEFLEDQSISVIEPGAVGESTRDLAAKLGIQLCGRAKLLELSRGLTVRIDQKVSQHRNLSTGEANLIYEETHRGDGGAKLKVPNGFVIGIPVFEGGPAYQIPVRLRYRVRGGMVKWVLDLHRPEDSFRHAFEEACDRAQAGTGLPLFFGSPE